MRVVSMLYAGLCACGFQPAPAFGDGHPSEAGAIDASDGPRDGTVTPVCDPGDLDLRACFVFDGTTTDGSSYHNDASATGTTYTTGHTGQAIVTGPSSNVTVAPTTSFDVAAMTLKLWIRPASLSSVARAGLIDSAGRFRIFLQPGGAIRCALTGGADLTSSTGVVTTNAWQRIACTYDRSTMKIYVDGAMVAMLPQSGTIPTPGSGIVIGQNNPTGEQFDGAIDELQVWASIVAP